jgi:tetratricopeptide (TPR) repeat protein
MHGSCPRCCEHAVERGGYTNTVKLSADGRALASADPTQAFVGAKRIGAPAPNAAPPAQVSPAVSGPPAVVPAGPSPAPASGGPSNAIAAADLWAEGRKLASGGQCKDAIGYFNRAIQADPRHSRSYSDRGRCLAMMGQLDKGIDDLNRAVQYAPDDMSSYYNRAGLWADAGLGDAALSDLDRSIRLNPMNAAPRAARAAVFEAMGRPQDAQLDAEIAYKQVDTFMSKRRAIVDQVLRTWRAKRMKFSGPAPAAAGDPLQAAVTAMAAKNDREALMILEAALVQRPNDDRLLAYRGHQRLLLGHATQAVDDLTALLRRMPSTHAYVDRGLAFRQLCRFREEMADYDQAVKMDPRFVKAYFERAFATMFYDKRRDAVPDLTKVIELDPGNWLAYNFRGDLNRYWFQLPAAIADFRHSIQLNPNFAQAHCNLAFVLREGKRMNDYQASLERCYALDPSEREVARKEFAKIQVKEEQGARDLAAYMEWLKTRPKGDIMAIVRAETRSQCDAAGGDWWGSSCNSN